MTVGSGCLCSVPSPAWPLLSIAPRLGQRLSSLWWGPGQPPAWSQWAAGPVAWPGSLNLIFLIWEVAGVLPPPTCRQQSGGPDTAERSPPQPLPPEPCRPGDTERPGEGLPSPPPPPPASQWRGRPLPYSSPPHTPSRCPGSQWGSQRPAWSPPSSPGTVACGPAAAAGCWGRGLTRASQRYGREGPQGVRVSLCHIQGHLPHCVGKAGLWLGEQEGRSVC